MLKNQKGSIITLSSVSGVLGIDPHRPMHQSLHNLQVGRDRAYEAGSRRVRPV
jgi:hypothetical protein